MKKGALLFLVIFTLLFTLLGGCKPTPPTPPKPTGKKQNNPIPYNVFTKFKSGVKTNLNAISFISSPRGIIAGDHGTILLTSNGGHSWSTVGAGLTTLNLYGAAMADTLVGIVVGEKGMILRSINGGLNWDSVKSGNLFFHKTLRGVAFYSNSNGYAVGDSGVIFFTKDAGTSWIKMHGDPTKIFNGLSFNSSNYLCVVGNDGVFGLSKDLGTTLNLGGFTKKNLRSIHFSLNRVQPYLHSDSGFIVGDAGIIFKTLDGGLSWTFDTSHVTKNLRGVFLTNPHWGYAVGDSGTVIRYNGRNWMPMASPTTLTLNGIDPVYWNPTETCVGESGSVFTINPPLANDGTALNIEGQSDCSWNFTLTTGRLQQEGFGTPVTYTNFEVCSSIEQSVFGGGGPSSGWVYNDRFFSKTGEVMPHTQYPNSEHPLAPLIITTNPTWGPTSGVISCYYKDKNENYYLIRSDSIWCSP